MGLERHAGRLWASTSGGPLLLVEASALASWGGLESGDYDRACETIDLVAEIDLGDRRGLILGDEPAMTTVVPRANGIVLVRWHAADDAERVERALDALSSSADVVGEESGLILDWRDSSLVLFDSVEPGDEPRGFDLPADTALGDGAIRVSLAPGRYAVRLGELDPEVGALSVVELRRT